MTIEAPAEESTRAGDPELEREVEAFRDRSLAGESHPYLVLRVVRSSAVAIGVDASGRREVIGVRTLRASGRNQWKHFIDDLVRRGLSGVRAVVAEPQLGLSAAVRKALHGPAILSSRDEVLRDLLSTVPAGERPLVAILVDSIYSQPTLAETRAQLERVLDQLRGRLPDAAERLDDLQLSAGFKAIPEAE